MPLKHVTETVLITILGAAMLCTGILLATLPSLPSGWAPWLLLFTCGLLYPIGLYPMLRRNRADYPFRTLHFFPAAMLLAWLLVQFLIIALPQAARVHYWFTWGYSVVSVLLGFVLLALFCLHVIRRRIPRLTILTVLLVPFLALATTNEAVLHWNTPLAATLWGGSWWGNSRTRPPVRIAQQQRSATILPPSTHPDEEAWRRKLRALEQRSSQVSSETRFSSTSSPSIVQVSTGALTFFGTTKKKITTALRPGHLPSAGVGTQMLALTLLAGYFGVLHQRAKRRLD